MDFQTFTIAFPEFETIDEKRVTHFIERAMDAVPNGRFGKETDFGRGLYTAHFLTVLGNGSVGNTGGATPTGTVVSKTVGAVSVSYDAGTASETDAGYWNATGYGRLFWQLMKKYRRLPTVVCGRARWP